MGYEASSSDSYVDTDLDSLEEEIHEISLQQSAHQPFDEKPIREPTQHTAHKLTYVQPLDQIVLLESEDMDDINKTWGFALIGYFTGRFPGKAAVLKLRDSLNVSCEYQMHPSGWLVFKFVNEIDRDFVLISGPHSVDRRHLLLKPLTSLFWIRCTRVQINACVDKSPKPAPWVLECQGYEQDLVECWVAFVLSNCTVTKQRISFARALVEVDYSNDLIESIVIRLPSGKTINQKLVEECEYEYCFGCEVIGHSANDCFTNNLSLGFKIANGLYQV